MAKKTAEGMGILRGEQASVVVFTSFDIQFIYEEGGRIPCMFLTRTAMEETMREMQLNDESEKLVDISPDNAVLYQGYYQNKRGHWLSLVFVRARWSSYRKALTAKNKSNNFIKDKLAHHIHADHVLFRGALKEEIYPSYDPWLLLVEVPAEANSGFGSAVERFLPSLEEAKTEAVTWLTPLQLFKIFCVDMPKTDHDRLKIMDNLKKQLIFNPTLFNDIQQAIDQVVATRKK
ncbi:hypothetical protein [Serratia proteamaculans]